MTPFMAQDYNQRRVKWDQLWVEGLELVAPLLDLLANSRVRVECSCNHSNVWWGIEILHIEHNDLGVAGYCVVRSF